ncbi:hypothetical protein OY671_007838, partial [Metschnikowia pulcherrima]
MASRAIIPGRAGADWRAVSRRSSRRSSESIGGTASFASMLFSASASASYTQTDPSGSTAAGGPVENWMGSPGAWAAERVSMSFGAASVSSSPSLFVFARRSWEAAGDSIDADEDEDPTPDPGWLRPTGSSMVAMVSIGTTSASAFTAPRFGSPAGMGGLTGSIGAAAVRAVAHLARPAEGWIILPVASVASCVGASIAGRVFAFDWARMFRLPRSSPVRAPQAADGADAPATPVSRKEKAERREASTVTPSTPSDVETAIAPRRPTELTDPSRATAPATFNAKARQGDSFSEYESPGLDSSVEAPASAQPKIDKSASERNARSLENVLDDFNVKGEITAVRTGPVVTMYESEPAPG